jgi:two-component system phosphate regulon sensor histidine kinase PhoR
MRAAETRISVLLVAAIMIAVGAAYWLVLRDEPRTEWVMARGGLLVGGAALCVLLAMVGLQVDSRRSRRRMLDAARQWVLSSAGALPAPKDPDIQTYIRPMRERVDELFARAEALQVQKKNLEIQLRLADAQRRQSQIMIHGISDAVIITDAFDELLQANPAAADLFKFDPAAGVRKPISQLLSETGAKLAADISDLRQNHSRTNRRALECVIEVDGEPRTFAVTLSCVTDSSDQLSGVVTMLHDRTRENEISKMKTDFVSHVSHELRTPLSSIKAYAELLVDGEATDDKTRTEFYHIIQAEADRLSRLIDNILNISRIESGMTRVNKKAVALTGILKQVLEVAMPSAREKQITLVDEVTPVFFSVEADRDMIYQAVLNLVSNAIKYTPAGGTVKIELAADEASNELTVLVTDTGVGIPADSMKHLFEKFYRVEQHKTMAKGSGLGLNLTRQIIEGIHKGRMIVTSEPGKGSTFGFALSIAA